jgi:hypothetical protein
MGGGGVNVPSFGSELGQVTSGFSRNVLPTFNQFVAKNPLLSTLGQYGLGFGAAAYPYLQQIIAGHGALTPQEANLATQQARGAFQARGNVYGNQAIGAEVLNRDQYRWNKLMQAMGMAGQTEQLLGYPAQTQAGVFSTLVNPLYGLAAQQLQAATSGQEANQQKQSDLIGAGIKSIGSVAGAAAMASDERIKTDIRDTGKKTPEGIPIKAFEYKTRPGARFVGVMAQDVEKVHPEAVVTDPLSGLKMVHPEFTPKQIPTWQDYARGLA